MTANAQPYGIIYLARNTVNGKGYVGQTTQELKARRRQHLNDTHSGSSLPFHRAIKKYGENAFTWPVLMVCDSRDDLDATEQAYISILRTRPPTGYNMNDGGASPGNVSAETRRKISEAKTGKALSPEHKRAIGEGGKGRITSLETAYKISMKMRGRRTSLDVRRKISQAHKRRREGRSGT